MRFVDRNAVSPPPSLTDPHGAGATENFKAKIYYLSPPPKAYTFRAYKSEDVVEALDALFHGKCAYCETSLRGTDARDIEHFRPKGEVTGVTGHPGYWWLAAEWTNLLPSCPACNREKHHRIVSPGMLEHELSKAAKSKAGKKNAFPIAGVRANCASDDHDAEDPLLIDPTRRNPANHLTWTQLLRHKPLGRRNVSVAIAIRQADGSADPYARESIAVYGLNRRGLVEDRTELLLSLEEDRCQIENLIATAAISAEPGLSALLLNIDAAIARFQHKAAPDKVYSAMAKDYIDQALLDMARQMQALHTPSPAP